MTGASLLAVLRRNGEARIVYGWTRFQSWSLRRRVFMVLFVTMVALFFVTSFWIGGDAFQGHVKDGHFFVREHSNSPEHEVSRTTYFLSLWEMRVLFAMWVVGFAGGLLHWLKLEG